MPSCGAYPEYGGRGIQVFAEWAEKGPLGTNKPSNGFLLWLEYVETNLGPKPEGYTLDRIDSEGDYVPGNIRWADIETQNRNRRHVSGRLGVRYVRQVPSGRYQVNVTVSGNKRLYLGTYDTIEEASAARDAFLKDRD